MTLMDWQYLYLIALVILASGIAEAYHTSLCRRIAGCHDKALGLKMLTRARKAALLQYAGVIGAGAAFAVWQVHSAVLTPFLHATVGKKVLLELLSVISAALFAYGTLCFLRCPMVRSVWSESQWLALYSWNESDSRWGFVGAKESAKTAVITFFVAGAVAVLFLAVR